MHFKPIAIFCLVAQAHGHGQMMSPTPRADPLGRVSSYIQWQPAYTINSPTNSYSTNAMRCRDFKNPSPITTINAGSLLPIDIYLAANHPGDCYLYVSYSCEGKPANEPCEPTDFFKIASFPGCGAGPTEVSPPNEFTLQAKIPPSLPACEHCVLRWEWTALHLVRNVEFYVQCADIKIVSSSPPTKPTPMVPISGIEHLPNDAEKYRKVYGGEYPDVKYLVGPAEAAFTSCTAGTSGCVGSGGSPVNPPTKPPSNPPTSPPSNPPTSPPSNPPTNPPSNPPTRPPSNPPSNPPTEATPPPTPLSSQICVNKVWNQCGGAGFKGSTCCPDGHFCNRQSEWYSQCIPGTVPEEPIATPQEPCSNKVWDKCGGAGFTGPICCPAGHICNRQNEWYSQCIPL